jgi:biopolymer transport protein ExbD
MPLKLNQDELPTVNLTSLIDILFLLIIFFMVGTRFSEDESNIQINLPKTAPSGAMLTGPSNKTVFVSADGTLQLDGQRVTHEQLTGLLAQAVQNFPDTTVQIKPDGMVTMQMAAEALSAVRRSGARVDGLTVAAYQMPNVRR